MVVRLALLCLCLSGCVTTEFTRGDMTVKRTAFWSDFNIEATALPDGSITVTETQSNQMQELTEFLKTLRP